MDSVLGVWMDKLDVDCYDDKVGKNYCAFQIMNRLNSICDNRFDRKYSQLLTILNTG